MARALRTMTWNEPNNLSDVIKAEASDAYCREVVTLKSGSGVLAIGAVLGKISLGAATSAAKSGGNTGTGTFVVDGTTPVLAKAKTGIYTLRCITAVTNGGVFRLEDPDGIVLGDITIPPGAGNSVTVSEHIKGVLSDATTDFIVGDGFDITVAAGSAKYVPYDPTALDGRQYASAILLDDRDTTAADATGVIVMVRGPAQVSLTKLIWGGNVTTQAQKDAAVAALSAAGIVARASA